MYALGQKEQAVLVSKDAAFHIRGTLPHPGLETCSQYAEMGLISNSVFLLLGDIQGSSLLVGHTPFFGLAKVSHLILNRSDHKA